MAAATLEERANLLNDPILTAKVKGAIVSAAVAIKYEDPGTANHAARLVWAKSALVDPVGSAPRALAYVVAAAAADDKSGAQISAMTDTEFQNYVNASVDVLST